MKKFYKNASFVSSENGFQVMLDSKPIKTPMKHDVSVKSQNLAQILSDEWNAQGDEIDPKSMPYNQLVNTMVDNVVDEKRRDDLSAEILRFVDSDLIFYYADGPDDLVKKQRELWGPVQKWFEDSYGLALKTSSGITYVEQDENLSKIAASILDDLSPEEFTAYQSVVGPLGSFIITLAFIKDEISQQVAFDSAFVDEIYQSERWGEDAEAKKKRDDILKELQLVSTFLKMSE
jgi:chaperone required for assembly of F1-ATPase